MIDGLKEAELGRGSIGTTGKGIGPTYSSKASRSGLRVHHLYNFEEFSSKFRTMVANKQKRYGNFEYDVEGEIERYKVCKAIISEGGGREIYDQNCSLKATFFNRLLLSV